MARDEANGNINNVQRSSSVVPAETASTTTSNKLTIGNDYQQQLQLQRTILVWTDRNIFRGYVTARETPGALSNAIRNRTIISAAALTFCFVYNFHCEDIQQQNNIQFYLRRITQV